MTIADLWLPILLSGLATHIYSTLAWMVLPHHKEEWNKLPVEDEFQSLVVENTVPAGQYIIPHCNRHEEMQTEAFHEKQKKCLGTLVLWEQPVSMGAAIAKTLAYFFAVAFAIGHLASLALPAGADPIKVFEFVAVAGLLAHVAGQFPVVFWFPRKSAMDTVDKIAFALITGILFAVMWPAGK